MNFKKIRICTIAAAYLIATICCIGCGGTETQRNPIPTTAMSEQSDMRTDTVDSVKVFSQITNAMIKIPYSELRVEYDSDLKVIGTTNGAVAAYFFGYWEDDPLEIELDNEDWRVFLNALLNCGISQWKRTGYNDNLLATEPESWELKIYTKDGDTIISSYGIDAYPPKDEWSMFLAVISDFIQMMKEKKQEQREMEYAKRFGQPMSEYERTIRRISYYHGTTRHSIIKLEAYGGAVLVTDCNVKLNIEDWLDIVNALGNMDNGSIKKHNVDTTLDYIYVYDSTMTANYYTSMSDNYNIYLDKGIDAAIKNLYTDRVVFIGPLPVSEELKNIMDAMYLRTRNKCDD